MAYQVLPPELVLHLLKGEVDVLTPMNTARLEKINRTPCPRCGAALHAKLNQQHPFSDAPLPRMWATCECGYEADFDSGIIVDRGSATKVKDPVPIIRPERG